MDKRFAIPGVDARTPLGEAAPRILLAKAEPLFALEDDARGGADMDAVHDMRVASRRLREAMRLLAPLYPHRDFRRWYRRARRVTRSLGPVRDSDVFIDAFARLGRGLESGGRRCVAFMVGYRMGQREHELAALNRELATLDLAESRASFTAVVHTIEGTAGADLPLASFAHAAVAERAAVVFGAQPAALEEPNTAEQHALRIDYKRLRYAVEAFAPCYGDEFDELHATLTAFQDTLGDLHDVHIFLDMLHDPDRVAAARRAGVSTDDIAEVVAVLDERAHDEFERFATHATSHPAERLLPALLLPLTRLPAPEPPGVPEQPAIRVASAAGAAEVTGGSGERRDASDDTGAVPGDEVPVEAPVVVGDEPWAEGW
ncbi:MAG: CHAD domain-containing protein, partial [Coriobacteriia bacterium]|nr:CHAD domain-containing protein [Coriobacteriia bacterium]